MRAPRKVLDFINAVRPKRGLMRAIKVAVGPELNECGLWPMSPTDRELIYHERQISGVGGRAEEMAVILGTSDEAVPRDIKPYLARYIPTAGKVLDVGCGPVSLLTGGQKQGRYSLTATDLLADSYQAILRAYGHDGALDGVLYLACRGEELSRKLPLDHFDVVSCNNALDHMDSPREALANMATVTRPAGVVIISGHSREGTHERWQGMHRHDLWLEGGKLWRAGREEQKANLAAGLPLTYVEGVETSGLHGDMVAVFRRTP